MKKNNIDILDSAMGTELINMGHVLPPHIWSAKINISHPDDIYQIHANNIKSGANLITTNTFRTTPRAYAKLGLSKNKAELNAKSSMESALRSCHKAAMQNTTILGSIAPLEDCYKPNLFPGEKVAEKEFYLLGSWLQEFGVDIILLETMNSIREIKSALHAMSKLTVPIYVSINIYENIFLKSGDSIVDIINLLKTFNINTLLFNCSSIKLLSDNVNKLVDNLQLKWGIYPNMGIGKPSANGVISNYENQNKFKSLIHKCIDLNARIIGGCCGTTHQHIKLIKKLTYEAS